MPLSFFSFGHPKSIIQCGAGSVIQLNEKITPKMPTNQIYPSTLNDEIGN